LRLLASGLELLTGCTEGIGRAYPSAWRGIDIVLVRQNLEKLRALEHGRRVLSVQADFTNVSILPVIVHKLKEANFEGT